MPEFSLSISLEFSLFLSLVASAVQQHFLHLLYIAPLIPVSWPSHDTIVLHRCVYCAPDFFSFFPQSIQDCSHRPASSPIQTHLRVPSGCNLFFSFYSQGGWRHLGSVVYIIYLALNSIALSFYFIFLFVDHSRRHGKMIKRTTRFLLGYVCIYLFIYFYYEEILLHIRSVCSVLSLVCGRTDQLI